jgi:mercuric ion transport protein
MTTRSEAGPARPAMLDTQGKGPALLATGGVLAALGASSCCVLPFALFTLGVSGAWIGNLTVLARYQPIFVALALACLAAGFFLIDRRTKAACVEESACARPMSYRIVKAGLWTGTLLVIGALAFPYIAPIIMDL